MRSLPSASSSPVVTGRRALTVIALAALSPVLVPSAADAAKEKTTAEKATFQFTVKKKVKIAAVKPAKRSGARVVHAGSKARWDFTTKRGVAYYTGGTKMRKGKYSLRMRSPHVSLTAKSGTVSVVIGSKRYRALRVDRRKSKTRVSARRQHSFGMRLKLTKSGAVRLNKALHRKVFRTGQVVGKLDMKVLRPQKANPTNPNPQPPNQATLPQTLMQIISGAGFSLLPSGVGTITPTGAVSLPVASSTFDTTTRTGTVTLNGGFVIRGGSAGDVTVNGLQAEYGVNSGLYGSVNGVRVKLLNLDSGTLAQQVSGGQVSLTNLLSTLSPEGAAALNGATGSTAFIANTPTGGFSVSVPAQ